MIPNRDASERGTRKVLTVTLARCFLWKASMVL